jgi:Tol biopolymer transport system component/DNA-binding winged helix-turn-helix (wHTH) protein
MRGSSQPAVVCFGNFEVDLRAGELRKDGQRVRLQEQPFRVLALLLRNPGQSVTREELRQNLWPVDTFVDFDHGLNSAVARLREALGDAAEKPRYVETVAKRGYRFIGAVSSTEPVSLSSGPFSTKFRTVFAPARRSVWVGALALLALVLALGSRTRSRLDADAQLARIEVVPVVALRGFQATPAFSPDGTLVAFRQSDGHSNTGIYVAVVGGDKSIQLTREPGDCCPTWSPDGREIAFTRYDSASVSVYTIPALGGTEHRLYRSPPSMSGGLSWSSDGNFIVFPGTTDEDPTHVSVLSLSIKDGSARPLTSPPAGYLDHEPAFSPDGSKLAFIRSTVAGVANDVYVMPATGGFARRITFDNRPIMGPPAWTADSREIVFSSDRGASTGLWRVSAFGGAPRPAAGPVGEPKWPSIPATGNSLVYEQVAERFNIFQLRLTGTTRAEGSPSLLVSEKGDKMRPELSPDGTSIAFESNRLGFWEIWTCKVSGNDCAQVTALNGTAGRARWSPNGRYIAFEFHPNERGEIFVVEVPGGIPRLLTTIPGSDNLSPSWSHDGKWLYFASKCGREPFEVWKMHLPDGVPIKLTANGGISPVESVDGRYLYYAKYEKGGVWRLPLQDGQQSGETEVIPKLPGTAWPDWALGSDGIYYLKTDEFPGGWIDFYEFASTKTIPLWHLDRNSGWGLSLSRDGRSLVFVQNEFAESNIMLVKNFR